MGRDEGKTAKHATLDGYSKRSAKDQSGVREREGGSLMAVREKPKELS